MTRFYDAKKTLNFSKEKKEKKKANQIEEIMNENGRRYD
jgi:hypothetical protein